MAFLPSLAGRSPLPKGLIAATLGVLVLANWKLGAAFFWMDELMHLIQFQHLTAGFFLEPWSGHLKPLFKVVYQAQVALFGTNAQLYHYVNLAAWALLCLAVYDLNRDLVGQLRLALAFAAILAAHTTNYKNILWSHQLCVVLHLFFQVLYFRRFWAWLVGGRRTVDLGWALMYLVVQNYFFGNGLFFPLVGVVALVAYEGWRPALRMPALWAHLALLVAFAGGTALALHLARMPGVEGGSRLGEALLNLDAVAMHYLRLGGTLVLRFYLLKDELLMDATPWVGLVLGLSLMVGVYRTLRPQRTLVLALVAWVAVGLAPVALGRYMRDGVKHHYNSLIVVPLLLLNLLPVAHIREQRRRLGWGPFPLFNLLFGTLMVVYFLANQHAVDVFNRRNALNQQAMVRAVRSGQVYIPYDDPSGPLAGTWELPQPLLAQQHLAAQAYLARDPRVDRWRDRLIAYRLAAPQAYLHAHRVGLLSRGATFYLPDTSLGPLARPKP